MKPAKTGAPLSASPFHVRAAIALGMWSALGEVASKGFRVPKSLGKLTEQLILEAANTAIAAVTVGVCRGCGCTDDRGCPGGCYWVSPNLCSSCALGVMTPGGAAAFDRQMAREAHRAKRSKAGRAKR